MPSRCDLGMCAKRLVHDRACALQRENCAQIVRALNLTTVADCVFSGTECIPGRVQGDATQQVIVIDSSVDVGELQLVRSCSGALYKRTCTLVLEICCPTEGPTPYPHLICTLSTPYLHLIYTLSTPYLHIINTLSTPYQHPIYTLYTPYLHLICT